jgi:hypothetical protein
MLLKSTPALHLLVSATPNCSMLETLKCEVRETLVTLNPGSELVYVIVLPKNASIVDIFRVQHTSNTDKHLTDSLVFRWITNMPVSLARNMYCASVSHRRYGDATIVNGYAQQI